MVVTSKCPAYLIGYVTIQDNLVLDFEGTFLWILRYFKGKNVNVFIEDYGLRRNIRIDGSYPIPKLLSFEAKSPST